MFVYVLYVWCVVCCVYEYVWVCVVRVVCVVCVVCMSVSVLYVACGVGFCVLDWCGSVLLRRNSAQSFRGKRRRQTWCGGDTESRTAQPRPPSSLSTSRLQKFRRVFSSFRDFADGQVDHEWWKMGNKLQSMLAIIS